MSVVNLVWINKVILKIARRDWFVLNFTMMWVRLPADVVTSCDHALLRVHHLSPPINLGVPAHDCTG